MRVASQCPLFRPRPVATDGSPWLALPGCQVPEPVAAWPARVPGRGRRCQRAEQGRHDLAGITWCGEPHRSLSARMVGGPRPVSAREPGVRGAGAAL
jgi:hypothetical protein